MHVCVCMYNEGREDGRFVHFYICINSEIKLTSV